MSQPTNAPADLPLAMVGRAAQMRAEFDAAFSRMPAVVETELTDVLALRIGVEPGLLRLSEVAEIRAHPVLTPVPTSARALLGIAAGRGSPVAAYDLGLLLGRAPVTPRWLVLAAAEPAVGLIFEHFDGYQRIALAAGGSRRLVEMSTLIEAITRLAPHRSSNQEIVS